MTELTDLSAAGIRAWLLASCAALGITMTALAREAKVARSTLNRFAHKAAVSHRLSASTLEKVRTAIARLENRPAGPIKDAPRINNGKVRIAIDQFVTVNQAARIFAILDEPK